MDSISQFVLGAAVGEAVLGKKIGNKALLWGGIAGTIPDLDILSGHFLTKVEELAAHRGISHSIFFSIVGGLFLGWMIFALSKKFFPNGDTAQLVSLRRWQWMFFLAIITHALLDCFTMYGTQLFAPFSDYRVAFSTVAVADPLYTLPFMICLSIVLFYKRESSMRIRWNYIGIGWSCLYLFFTVVNKNVIHRHFVEQLEIQDIKYNRLILGPTILNNVLWSATVETDSIYYQGQYSWFDDGDITFNPIEKNHDLLVIGDYDKTIDILKWFTAGYYNVMRRRDGRLQINDLRYGTFRGKGDGENDYVFRFILAKDNGSYYIEETKGGPEPGDEKMLMAQLWDRIKGIQKG